METLAMKIIKTIMFHLGYDSVQKFADDIGANYMQVYYIYSGKTTNISLELQNKILKRFPNVSKDFIRTGAGEIEGGEREYRESFAPEGGVTMADMFRLLERVTTLMDKLQQREEILLKRMDELRAKEEELDAKIKALDSNRIQNCG